MRIHVFYKHTNIVTKKWGEKREKIFFQKTHVNREIKTMEKNCLEKVRKHVFYEDTNIATTKWGWGGNAGKKLSKNTRIGYQKIVGKKSSGKSVKIRLL